MGLGARKICSHPEVWDIECPGHQPMHALIRRRMTLMSYLIKAQGLGPDQYVYCAAAISG